MNDLPLSDLPSPGSPTGEPLHEPSAGSDLYALSDEQIATALRLVTAVPASVPLTAELDISRRPDQPYRPVHLPRVDAEQLLAHAADRLRAAAAHREEWRTLARHLHAMLEMAQTSLHREMAERTIAKMLRMTPSRTSMDATVEQLAMQRTERTG
jgi:hypothetical protein